MLVHRPAEHRGHANHVWLDTWHTFSFNTFYDPAWVQWSVLRVINEDVIAPGRGFATHPHRDMEIITYVVSGALAHRDSMGHESVMRPGVLQHMTAGSGITHSEYNASPETAVHLLQIWIVPDATGYEPHYAELDCGVAEVGAGLRLLVSPNGNEDSLSIRQDVHMYDARLASGESRNFTLGAAKSAWLQVIEGRLTAAGVALKAGDGLGIKDIAELELLATEESLLLVFDLP